MRKIKMKLLIVAFPESVHTARWINQLQECGWEIYLFPSVDNDAIHEELKNITIFKCFYRKVSKVNKTVKVVGIPVIGQLFNLVLHMILNKYLPNYYKRYLEWVIRHYKPDIIHSMETQHAGYLVSSVKGIWKGVFPKWLTTVWGSDLYYFGRFPEHKKKIQEVLSGCDFYSCECLRDVHLAKRLGLRGKDFPVFPINGGFNISEMNKYREKVQPSKRKAIMLKGYQGWAGRAQVALHALDRCGELLNGYELIIYSIQPNSGVEIAARLLAEKYNLKLNLIPLHTHNKKILELHGRSRISIGLSISDGLPASFLEAMVMGSFPIQSSTSCADEWAEDGRSCILVPPEDPSFIEKAIRMALTDDELVDKASKENYKIAEVRLNSQILKEKSIKLYEDIYREE